MSLIRILKANMRAIFIVLLNLLAMQALLPWQVHFAWAQNKTMNEYDLKAYTYGPVSGGKPKQMIILLHGLGADGRDLIGLAPLFATRLTDTVFVAPNAPFPCDMAPMGYQWFSLQDRSEETMLAGVQKAAPILDHFITDQISKHQVPEDRVALLGFSQGTMMALYVAPRYPARLAGVLGYSGALIGGEGLDDGDIFKIPVHLLHGDNDDVVPVERFYAAGKILKEKGFAVTGGVIPGLTHSIDENGIISGGTFLELILR